MKRLILVLALVFVAVNLFAQYIPLVKDSTNYPTDRKYREGIPIAGKNTSTGKWEIVDLSESGSIPITDKYCSVAYVDSVEASSADTTYLVFPVDVQAIQVYSDDVTLEFRVGLAATTPNVRVAAGAIENIPVEQDTISVTAVSGSGTVFCNGFVKTAR